LLKHDDMHVELSEGRQNAANNYKKWWRCLSPWCTALLNGLTCKVRQFLQHRSKSGWMPLDDSGYQTLISWVSQSLRLQSQVANMTKTGMILFNTIL